MCKEWVSGCKPLLNIIPRGSNNGFRHAHGSRSKEWLYLWASSDESCEDGHTNPAVAQAATAKGRRSPSASRSGPSSGRPPPGIGGQSSRMIRMLLLLWVWL